VPSTASQYTISVLMTKYRHRNSPVSDVEVAITSPIVFIHSRDVTSSSDSAVLLATVGLSVYGSGTNSLSNCRRCIIWPRVAVSF